MPFTIKHNPLFPHFLPFTSFHEKYLGHYMSLFLSDRGWWKICYRKFCSIYSAGHLKIHAQTYRKQRLTADRCCRFLIVFYHGHYAKCVKTQGNKFVYKWRGIFFGREDNAISTVLFWRYPLWPFWYLLNAFVEAQDHSICFLKCFFS